MTYEAKMRFARIADTGHCRLALCKMFHAVQV